MTGEACHAAGRTTARLQQRPGAVCACPPNAAQYAAGPALSGTPERCAIERGAVRAKAEGVVVAPLEHLMMQPIGGGAAVEGAAGPRLCSRRTAPPSLPTRLFQLRDDPSPRTEGLCASKECSLSACAAGRRLEPRL